ncbi:MAG: response regulator [Terricaulis sp.]
MSFDDPFDPSGLTALVLDENHYERGISLDQLRTMGFGRVIGVPNTLEAWDVLRRVMLNIVLLEWLDDSNDGLDFVRRIRNTEDLPNRAASIFMLTGRGSLADVERARQAGVDGYLRKPISGLVLQQRIRSVITRPQPFVVTSTYVGPCRRRKRPDLNYTGPLRRLDDVTPETHVDTEEELNLKAELARARVAALEAAVQTLSVGDATAARRVYQAVQRLVDVGDEIGDANIVLGAREMARYLQAQGAERLEPEVVRTHVAALHQLVHLPHALGGEREAVARGLQRMVDKKLRQAQVA